MAYRKPPRNYNYILLSQPEELDRGIPVSDFEENVDDVDNITDVRTRQPFASNLVEGIGGAAGTVMGFVGDIVNNSKSQITIPQHTNYYANRINTLDDVYGIQSAQQLDTNALHKPNANDFGLDFLSKSAQGAMAGSSFGPWGALAGAAVGGTAAIGNFIAKKNTYKNDFHNMTSFNNEEGRLYNQAYNRGIKNTTNNRNLAMNIQRTLSNYAAGGQMGQPELSGVTQFNTGGTHEMNPNGGIPQGVDPQGKPNLVEQGEVKWNDFIFSKRIRPQANVLDKYNTQFHKAFASYADAANFILELHKERENNPFDKASLKIQMQRLADAQEYQKSESEAEQYGLTSDEYAMYLNQSNQAAYGGNLYSNGGKYYNIKTHQFVNDNPNNDPWLIPVDPSQHGQNYVAGYQPAQTFYDQYWNGLTPTEQQTLLEEFQSYYNSPEYIPINVNNQSINKYSIKGKTLNDLYKLATDTQWGPMHQAWVNFMWMKMHPDITYDEIPQPLFMPQISPIGVTDLPKAIDDPQLKRASLPENITSPTTSNTDDTNSLYPGYADILRVAPIFNNIRQILTQNEPDYTYANQLASLYRPLVSHPVGRYQRYSPIDQYYLNTQANQRANTQYDFYRNNAPSKAIADYYATLSAATQSNAINNAYIQANQYNNQQRNAVLQYNNELDRANESARQQTQASNISNYANIMGNAYQAAEAERLAVENAREANMQNLAQNLGDLGREMYDRWRIDNDPALSYDTLWRYKGLIPWLYNANYGNTNSQNQTV